MTLKLPPDFSRSTMAVVMAGGDGKRLRPLTLERAKPAVPFAGIYRIIDFTLSNCINSGLWRILVLTQYKSDSLLRHLEEGWNILSPELGHFIYNMPPQKRVGDSWYQGTADSVYQNLFMLRDHRPEYVVILSADHIYKMDYRKILAFHVETDADCVLATNPIPKEECDQFGVVVVDDDFRVTDFKEKVTDAPTMPGNRNLCLANMGIYTFKAEVLYERLEEFCGNNLGYDFGHHVLPSMVERGMRVMAWPFEDENRPGEGGQPYWRDVGTLDAYFDSSMELVSVAPQFNMYDERWPVRTTRVQVPPAKFVFADEGPGARRGVATDSVVAGGCILSGGSVHRSLLAHSVRINSWARAEESILFHHVSLGRYSRLRRVICDKNVTIPPKMEIGFDPELDRKRGFVVTENGVTVIGSDARIPEPPVQVAVPHTTASSNPRG